MLQERGDKRVKLLRHDLLKNMVQPRDEQDDLLILLVGAELLLSQHARQPLPVGKQLFGRFVKVAGKLRERLHLAVLREVKADRLGRLFHRLGLRVAAHAGHGQTHVHRRPLAGEEQARFQNKLTVGNRNDVRRDIGRHVARLCLDDRQRRDAAAALFIAQVCRALKQAGVQIEHVAGVGLAAGRTLQQQAHRAVGDGVLGKIVVDDQHVLARVGGAAQTKAMKKAVGTLRLDLAQYREMEVFTQFSSDLDEDTKNQLAYGQSLMYILRQGRCSPLSQAQQIVTLVILFVIGVGCVFGYLSYYYKTTSLSAKYSAEERYAKNTQMTQVLADTENVDPENTVTIVESAYKKFLSSETTYTVAVYTLEEDMLEGYDKDLETIRGLSKSKARDV